MDFAKYPIYNEDISPFLKKFATFVSLYKTMINAFDEKDIVLILTQNLNSFFDKFDNYIKTVPKIEKEDSMEQ